MEASEQTTEPLCATVAQAVWWESDAPYQHAVEAARCEVAARAAAILPAALWPRVLRDSASSVERVTPQHMLALRHCIARSDVFGAEKETH